MRRRGAVLVMTLAVLTAVITVLAATAATQRLAFKAATNRTEKQRAEILAQSGLQRALASLSAQNPNATTQSDEWYTLGDYGNDRFLMDDGSFRLQIVDANSLVNLNTASQQQLLNLPLTESQVESLLDWRSTGATARPNGAKDSYYNQLTVPYNTAEKTFDSVDELLLVKDFTPATLYQASQGGVSTATMVSGSLQNGPNPIQQNQPTLYQLVTVDSISSNTTPQGQPKVNANTATQQQLQQRGIPLSIARTIVTQRRTRTFATLGDLLRVNGVTTRNAAMIIDNLTVSNATPTGKLDLNTVSESILNTVPNLPPDTIQAILQRQPNAGFTSVGQLATVQGMSMRVLQDTADLFTTGSRSFVVRVVGTAGDVSVPLEAVVTISASATPATGTTANATTATGTARIAKIYQPPYHDMTTYWGWQTDTTTDVDMTTGAH